MKRAVALALAVLTVLGASVATAVAAKKQRGPFAGATTIELVLTKRDGSTSTLTVARAKGALKGVFRGVVHAEVTVTTKNGATRQYQYDRGRVTAVGGGSITLRQPGKRTVSLTVDASTIVRTKGAKATAEALATGGRAAVFSQGGKAVLIRFAAKSTS